MALAREGAQHTAARPSPTALGRQALARRHDPAACRAGLRGYPASSALCAACRRTMQGRRHRLPAAAQAPSRRDGRTPATLRCAFAADEPAADFRHQIRNDSLDWALHPVACRRGTRDQCFIRSEHRPRLGRRAEARRRSQALHHPADAGAAEGDSRRDLLLAAKRRRCGAVSVAARRHALRRPRTADPGFRRYRRTHRAARSRRDGRHLGRQPRRRDGRPDLGSPFHGARLALSPRATPLRGIRRCGSSARRATATGRASSSASLRRCAPPAGLSGNRLPGIPAPPGGRRRR
jgi:hypothetical protein